MGPDIPEKAQETELRLVGCSFPGGTAQAADPQPPTRGRREIWGYSLQS